MPDIEIGVAAINVRIGERRRRVQPGGECVGRGVVDRMREAVGRQPLQPAREAPLEFDLKGVIVRRRRAAGVGNVREIRIQVRQLIAQLGTEVE